MLKARAWLRFHPELMELIVLEGRRDGSIRARAKAAEARGVYRASKAATASYLAVV